MTSPYPQGISYSTDENGTVWATTYDKDEAYFDESHYDAGYSRELDDYEYHEFVDDYDDDYDLRQKKIERRKRLQRKKDRRDEHRQYYPHLYEGEQYDNPIYNVLKKRNSYGEVIEEEEEEERKDDIVVSPEVVKKKKNDDNTISPIIKETGVEVSQFEEITIAREFMAKSSAGSVKPFDKMSLSEIADYLSCHVLYQEDAIDEVAQKVDQCTTSRLAKHDTNVPFNLLLSGVSGVGKTQTLKDLKDLFQMGIGQVNEDAYIEYRFGDMNDESASNFITGAPPGYIGHTKSSCLYDLLKKAATHYENIAKLEKGTTEDHQQHHPYIILIVFDEIDKANKKIMNPLNSLLSEGTVSNYAQNDKFVVPRNTRLLICSTANFGEEQMLMTQAKMTDYYEEAKTWIKEEMSVRGYPNCDISRMGEIIPFFPPSKKELIVILIKRFYENMMKNAFSTKFGLAEIGDEDLVKFINSMLERYDENQGIRDACLFLDRELSAFSSKSVSHFDKEISSDQILPLNPPAQIQFESIPYHEDLSKDLLVKSNPTIEIAVQDRFNSKKIDKRLKAKSAIDYLSVTHPSFKKCINVLAPVVYNSFNVQNKYYVNHHHHHDNSSFLRQLLNQRDSANNSLTEIENVIQTSSSDHDAINEIGNIIKKAKSSSSASSSSVPRLQGSSSSSLQNRTPTKSSSSSSSFSDDDENEEKEREYRMKFVNLKRKVDSQDRDAGDDNNANEEQQRLTNYVHNNHVKLASKSITYPSSSLDDFICYPSSPIYNTYNKHDDREEEEHEKSQYDEDNDDGYDDNDDNMNDNEHIFRSFERNVEPKYECPQCCIIKPLSRFKRYNRRLKRRKGNNNDEYESDEISLDMCNSCRAKGHKNKK